MKGFKKNGKFIPVGNQLIHSKRLKFNDKNIADVPKESGVYEFFSKDGKSLYVGVATKGKYANLRHRIESYKEKDDFSAHPTKKPLRKEIHDFSYLTVPISQARRIEKANKSDTEFNMDHNIGTWKR